MKSLIVVPTHRSGTAMLENLLRSFNGYDRYPILVVELDARAHDDRAVKAVVDRFGELPLSFERMETNSFELGGLVTAYQRTSFDEFFLLPHSCEVVDAEIFTRVFEEHAGRSVAFGLQHGNWNAAVGRKREHEAFILEHLDAGTHEHLLTLGDLLFWQGHIGKYRRAILDRMPVLDYVPTNMIEAISKSELLFTTRYHALDPDTAVLFPDWIDGQVIRRKFGRDRLKIANRYLIKWKTHWSPSMVFDDMKGIEPPVPRGRNISLRLLVQALAGWMGLR